MWGDKWDVYDVFEYTCDYVQLCILYMYNIYIHIHSIHIYIHNRTHSIHICIYIHIYIYTVSQYFLMYIMRCTEFKNQFQVQGSCAAPTDWVPVTDRRPDNRRSNFKPSQARLVCRAIFFFGAALWWSSLRTNDVITQDNLWTNDKTIMMLIVETTLDT